MLVVFTKGAKRKFDVVLATIAAPEVRIMVCLSVRNEVQHFAMSARNEHICSNRLMFVMLTCLSLLQRMFCRILMFLAAIAVLEVRMLVSFSVRNEFDHLCP